MNNTDNNSLPTALCSVCGDDTFSPQHKVCQLCALDMDSTSDRDPDDDFPDYEPREDFGYFGEAGLWD